MLQILPERVCEGLEDEPSMVVGVHGGRPGERLQLHIISGTLYERLARGCYGLRGEPADVCACCYMELLLRLVDWGS